MIGGGSAGLVASLTAAGLGARVALVERDRPGGDFVQSILHRAEARCRIVWTKSPQGV